MKTIFFNADLIFTPKVFILCKKVWERRWKRALNFDIPSLLQLFIKEKILLNSFFQQDFVSKLNETMKLVTKIFKTVKEDGGFV